MNIWSLGIDCGWWRLALWQHGRIGHSDPLTGWFLQFWRLCLALRGLWHRQMVTLPALAVVWLALRSWGSPLQAWTFFEVPFGSVSPRVPNLNLLGHLQFSYGCMPCVGVALLPGTLFYLVLRINQFHDMRPNGAPGDRDTCLEHPATADQNLQA